MFEFLANAPSAQVISVAYYAIRLINHRVVIQDDAVSVPQIAEASPEEQKLVLRVIDEVQRYERASLEDLTSREVERYVLALGRIAEERSRREVQQAGITAEKADELLNELVEAQMAERELPGLRARPRERIGVPLDSISFGDLYEHSLRERKLTGGDLRDYMDLYGEPSHERSDYERRQERREREYDLERERAVYGFSRSSGSPMHERRIADEVIARLEERIGRQARNVNVFVENRIVLLTGTVSDVQISNIAGDIAESIVGPTRVVNLIHVDERESSRARSQGGSGYGYRGRQRFGRFSPFSRYPGLAHRREEDDEDELFERGQY